MTDEWTPTDETYSTDGPVCPHCGYQHEHDGGYFYDESLTEFDCEGCGKSVAISVYTLTTWSCSVPLD